jgi:hypothetical protein
MAEAGFKWKNLTNDAVSGRRYQVMSMRRPPAKLKSGDAKMNSAVGKEPIVFEGLVFLQLNKGQKLMTESQKTEKSSEIFKEESTVDNTNCLLSALSLFCAQNVDSLIKLAEANPNLQEYTDLLAKLNVKRSTSALMSIELQVS